MYGWAFAAMELGQSIWFYIDDAGPKLGNYY